MRNRLSEKKPESVHLYRFGFSGSDERPAKYPATHSMFSKPHRLLQKYDFHITNALSLQISYGQPDRHIHGISMVRTWIDSGWRQWSAAVRNTSDQPSPQSGNAHSPGSDSYRNRSRCTTSAHTRGMDLSVSGNRKTHRRAGNPGFFHQAVSIRQGIFEAGTAALFAGSSERYRWSLRTSAPLTCFLFTHIAGVPVTPILSAAALCSARTSSSS